MGEYAKRVAKSVTGRDDIPVYMSSHYNDVPITDLKSETKTVSFLGDLSSQDIYMDLFNGWNAKSQLTQKIQLLRVK